MDIVKIVDEYMSQNSYVVIDGEDAVLIDAGVYVNKVEEVLKMFTPKPIMRAVLLTHAHFDHIRELDNILAKYKCQAYICKSGKPMLYKEDQNMSILDTPIKIKAKRDVKTFVDGDSLEFGNLKFDCYNTPGHSADSSCFVIGENMFTGDTVFKVGVGRTDLYSGDENVLAISLERIKDTLSNDIKMFYAGHGANFDKSELDYNISRTLEVGF